MYKETITLSQDECLQLVKRFGKLIPKSIFEKINPVAKKYKDTKKYWDIAEKAKTLILNKDRQKDLYISHIELTNENSDCDSIVIPKNCIGIWFDNDKYYRVYYVHWNYKNKKMVYEYSPL